MIFRNFNNSSLCPPTKKHNIGLVLSNYLNTSKEISQEAYQMERNISWDILFYPGGVWQPTNMSCGISLNN